MGFAGSLRKFRLPRFFVINSLYCHFQYLFLTLRATPRVIFTDTETQCIESLFQNIFGKILAKLRVLPKKGVKCGKPLREL